MFAPRLYFYYPYVGSFKPLGSLITEFRRSCCVEPTELRGNSEYFIEEFHSAVSARRHCRRRSHNAITQM